MRNILTPTINIFIQGLTQALKFILMFFLARYLKFWDFAQYTLLTTAIAYSLYLIGLDFYTYSSRELALFSNNRKGHILKSKAYFFAIVYLIAAPAIVISLYYFSWSPTLIAWFLAILLFEFINQEISRTLIALSHQVNASFLNLIRQAIWVPILIVLISSNEQYRNVEYIYTFILCANIIATLFGIFVLNSLNFKGWSLSTDWVWIKSGISKSITLLIATLSLRLVFLVDRFYIDLLFGANYVARYALLFGIANTIIVFLEAGALSFAYPKLIFYAVQKDHQNSIRLLLKTLTVTLVCIVFFGALSTTLLPFITKWIGNPNYYGIEEIYPLFISSFSIYSLSLIAHYGLYALKKDTSILMSQILATTVFISSLTILRNLEPELIVPISLNISFSVLLISKTISLFNAYRLILNPVRT